jgi:uncharacterized protein involved in outer membrane biogenesis/tetratricopeptide (TPR) repeat protein
MQKTLLSAAIALILVLVTALAAPPFVEWGHYRKAFETEISRLTGLDVRIGGKIDLRLLPTPTLTLRQIALGRPDGSATIRAEALRIELALSALMRGQLLASEVALEAPDVSLKFGGPERPEWAAPLFAFDPDAVSVSHLSMENGRVVLTDGTGRTLLMDRLGFNGEVRSLLGPIMGEGAVAVDGDNYVFRVAADRVAAGGAVKVRVLVDTIDRARIGDVDSFIWIERGMPHFAGSLQWSRPGGRATDGFNEPWRLGAKMRGNWTAAAFEELDFQYGSGDRAVQLRGLANLALRARPELDVTLAASQIDLGRMVSVSPAARRRPLVALRALVEKFGAAKLPSMQMKIGLSAEAVTLADAPLQRVSANLHGEGAAWDLDSLELSAPGGTQLRLRGHVNSAAQGADFAGRGQMESRDPRALVAWLTAGGIAEAFTGPFRAEGDIRLGTGGAALDRFKAEFDRDTLEGNVAYFGPEPNRSGRVSATLSASNIDLDRAYALLVRISADTDLGAPREGSLSLNVERATIGGVEARGTDLRLRFDERAVTVERLAIGDFGGARLAGTGTLDVHTLAPRGTVSLDLDMRAPDGVATLVEKFNAPAAAALRRTPSGLFPAKLQASLANDAQAAREAGLPAGAGFKLEGSAGAYAFDVHGVADVASDGSLLASLAQLGSTKVVVAGRIDARDGRDLVEAAGLDRLVSVDGRPGSLDFKASGRLDGAMAATAQVSAGGLDASIDGTVRAAPGQAVTANLMLTIARANVQVPQAATLPTTMSARLSYADGAIVLSQIAGTIAESDVTGRLAIGLSPTMNLEGDIKLGAVNLAAMVAATTGAPAKHAGDGMGWRADPFAGGVLGQFRGRIAMASGRTVLAPNLVAENLHGVLNFGPSDIALDDFEANIAGGRISGRLAFARSGDERSARARVTLTKADLPALFPGDPPPMSGRLNLTAEIDGRGRSPVALVRSLVGKGSFSIEGGRLARLDPSAFGAVIRSVDQGLPIQITPIGERLEAALAQGALSIQGDGSITATDGQASLTGVKLRAEGADVTVSARYDLAADTLDARIALIGPTDAGNADIGRPQIAIGLRGTFVSPRRTLDVAALSDWLLMRSIAQNAKRLAAIPAPLEARPIEPPPNPTAATRPAVPDNSVAVATPLPPSDRVKTGASPSPPNLAKPEPAAGPVATVKPEAPANPPPAAKPATDMFAATKPERPVDPPRPAPDAAPVRIPDEANLAPAPSPVDPRIAELDRVIAANPNDGATLAKRGQIFAVGGNFRLAIRDFDEVIRLRPQDAEAFNNRCWARTAIGDLEAALRDCNAALRLRPRYADAFDSRGMINLKSGQLSQAIADYDAALRINPKLASSLYGRGIARIRSNNAAAGNPDIVEAKSIQPNIAEEFAGYGIR